MTRVDSKAGQTPSRFGLVGVLVLVLAGWVFVATIELATMMTHRWIMPRIMRIADSFVWMVPLYYLAVFTLLGAALAGVTRFLPRTAAIRLTVVCTAALASFSILLLPLYGRVNQWALVLLAVGIGVQSGRWVLSRTALVLKTARVLVVALGVPILLLAAGVPAVARWQEKAWYGRLPAAAPGAPNVLLIILDTVRAASLGLYGHERPTTPNLTRRADEWVVFDHVYSTSPWTLPSHGSMFTGLYPHQMAADWLIPLERNHPTLAEAFRAAGYRTGGFVANLTYASRETGLGRGFIHYEDYPANRSHLKRATSLTYFLDTWRTPIKPGRRSRASKAAQEVSNTFLDWLDRTGERPFFVFLNYYDAHQPYRAPERLLPLFQSGNRVQDRYEAAIASLDQELDRLVGQLDQRSQLRNTIIVITSDHGELFGEFNLRGHANSLYLRVLEVPLLIRHDGWTPRGLRVENPVTLRDLTATIARLAGLNDTFPGHSLSRFWGDSASSGESPLIAHVTRGIRTPPEDPVSRGTMRAIFRDGYQLIINGDGQEEIFNLQQNPSADTDLTGTPAITSTRSALRAALQEAFADEVPRSTAAGQTRAPGGVGE